MVMEVYNGPWHLVIFEGGGGFKYGFIFTPTWGRFRFWLIFFRWVVQPPTSLACMKPFSVSVSQGGVGMCYNEDHRIPCIFDIGNPNLKKNKHLNFPRIGIHGKGSIASKMVFPDAFFVVSPNFYWVQTSCVHRSERARCVFANIPLTVNLRF